MEAHASTSSMSIDENGLRHFRMEADTGHLGITGMGLDQEPIEPIVPPELTNGIYSNLAYIRTNGDEVVLDFARINPNADIPTVNARIILTHGGALALAAMLHDKLSKAEA